MQERSDPGSAIQPPVEATPSASAGTNNFFITLRRVSHVAMLVVGQNFLLGNKLAEILVAHFQHSVVDLAFQIVHCARRRPRDTRAVQGKYCRVTGTDELLLSFDPRIRSSDDHTNLQQYAQRRIPR